MTKIAAFMAKNKSQRGWIYVDALIGTVILAVAMTAILMVYSQTTRSASNSKTYQQAALLAQGKLEELYSNEPLTQSYRNEESKPETRTIQDVAYQIQAVFLPATAEMPSSLNICTVTVTWKDPTARSESNLTMSAYFNVVE